MSVPKVNVEREALSVLGECGWFKAGLRVLPVRSGAGVCLQLALREATVRLTGWSWSPEREAAGARVDAVIAEQYPERFLAGARSSHARFNDHPDTTVDDVILVLEKAAIRRDEAVQ